MAKVICCTGLVCVDLVNLCPDFPNEDSDQRVVSLHWQRGGNAANASVTLALLGSNVDFIGMVPECDDSSLSWTSTAASLALKDFKAHGVGVSNIFRCHCEDFPTSSVIVNAKNGSRTILHSRGSLPELSLEQYMAMDLKRYKWIHFELRRNVDTIIKAMEWIKKHNEKQEGHNKVTVSIEFEKVREHNGHQLSPAKLADLVFIGKDIARHLGWNSALQTVNEVKSYLSPGAHVISTWGSEGAAFGTNAPLNVGEEVCARPVEKVVDSLGAGDVFIGGVIHSMSCGRLLGESVEFGCRVAERKLLSFGFDHVKEMVVSA